MNSILQITYRKKRQILVFLVFILFCFLFYRGLELHLENTVTNRIKYHAIPIAMSVLYHNHIYDYTGLRSIEIPFQSNDDLQKLIQSAKAPVIDQDRSIYYWVADDKGFSDFIIAAFYLFGSNLISMYYMWFLILFISTIVFLISFNKQLWALGFLCLIYLGIHLGISTLPLSSSHLEGMYLMEFASVYEPRFLDVLAFIQVMHMLFLSIRRKKFKWINDGIPLIIQLFIFINLYHARSSLGWEIVLVFSLCLFIICKQFYNKYKKNNAIVVVAVLLISIIVLNFYKHMIYNPKYFSEMGSRTIWHNALMGLAGEPYIGSFFTNKYGLTGINDLNVAQVVIDFANKNQICSKEVAELEPQILLNTLGNWGVANWPNYESCAKLLFFSIMFENKMKVFLQYIILKPMQSLHSLFILMKNSEKSKIGFHPLSLTNFTIFLLIAALSYKSLFRARNKLIFVTFTAFIFSFIPSVFFYNSILTLGGMLVIFPILFYLLLIIGTQKTFDMLKKEKITFHPQYPMTSKNLSIVIPAYNEEDRISLTIQEVYEIAKMNLDNFEIIVVDDGSTDDTYTTSLKTAHQLDTEIKIISQEINKGVGCAFHLGLAQAKFPQLCLIPGDNAYNMSSIGLLFSKCGLAPLVISYRKNMEARTPLRHFLSRLATLSLQIISGANVRDAHSLFLFPVHETRRLNIKSAGYGYHLEILSRLLRKFPSFVEVPVLLNPKPDASSGVMKAKTLLTLGMTIIKLCGLRLIKKL